MANDVRDPYVLNGFISRVRQVDIFHAAIERVVYTTRLEDEKANIRSTRQGFMLVKRETRDARRFCL